MKKHLFLEGPIQRGKSTLIKECLKPYMGKALIGGFSCKRYVMENGIAGAYGLTGPEDLEVEAAYDMQLHGNPDMGIEPEDKSIFAMRKGEGAAKKLKAFETVGAEMLRKSAGKKLMLLDEIGGLELMSEKFSTALYEVLAGDIPCIGVVKLNSKARFMTEVAGHPKGIAELNFRLRKDLVERFDAEIITFDLERRDEIKCNIEEFLREKIGGQR